MVKFTESKKWRVNCRDRWDLSGHLDQLKKKMSKLNVACPVAELGKEPREVYLIKSTPQP